MSPFPEPAERGANCPPSTLGPAKPELTPWMKESVTVGFCTASGPL
jgi:hypothetical protein